MSNVHEHRRVCSTYTLTFFQVEAGERRSHFWFGSLPNKTCLMWILVFQSTPVAAVANCNRVLMSPTADHPEAKSRESAQLLWFLTVAAAIRDLHRSEIWHAQRDTHHMSGALSSARCPSRLSSSPFQLVHINIDEICCEFFTNVSTCSAEIGSPGSGFRAWTKHVLHRNGGHCFPASTLHFFWTFLIKPNLADLDSKVLYAVRRVAPGRIPSYSHCFSEPFSD